MSNLDKLKDAIGKIYTASQDDQTPETRRLFSDLCVDAYTLVENTIKEQSQLKCDLLAIVERLGKL